MKLHCKDSATLARRVVEIDAQVAVDPGLNVIACARISYLFHGPE